MRTSDLQRALSLVTVVALISALPAPARAGGATRPAHRWRAAAARAAKDPHTWGPAAAAGAIAALDADRRISRWAVEHAPVFGSPQDADEASDDLRRLTDVAMITTALAAPRDHEGALGSRWMRLIIDEASVQAVKTTTSGLKELTGRERPNGEDDRSMPSGHTSSAFGYAALARRNVARMDMPRGGRLACDAAFDVVAGLTGWARVEAQKHYPTDVLVAASLGNFLASWIEEGTLGRHDVRVSVEPARDGFVAAVAWRPGSGSSRSRAAR